MIANGVMIFNMKNSKEYISQSYGCQKAMKYEMSYTFCGEHIGRLQVHAMQAASLGYCSLATPYLFEATNVYNKYEVSQWGKSTR